MANFNHTRNGDSHTPNGDSQEVKIAPPSGISVLVIGGGIGGLVAALECTRKGHSVRVFEREPTISSAGLHAFSSITLQQA
jgi:heterodisulfide reductase subunit A-like polyferredoxin